MAASRFAREGARLLKFGMIKDAGREFERGLEQDSSDRPCLLGLSRVKLAQRREAEARPLLERLIALEPQHPEVHAHLARLDFVAGDKGAVHRLRALCARKDAGFPELYNLGLTSLELGELDEAAQAFRLALKLIPESAHAHFNLGKVMRAKGDLPRALKCFKMARQLRPQDVDPYLHIVSTLVQQGELGQAAVALSKSLQALPESFELRAEAVKLALLTRPPAEALHAAEALRRLRPNDPDGAHLHAMALIGTGQFAAAEKALSEAFGLSPGSPEVAVTQARLLAATGRAAEAEAVLGPLAGEHPQAAAELASLRRGAAAN